MRLKDLAELLGTTKGVISRWETGDRGINLDTQFRLAEALKIHPSWLFWSPDQPDANAMLAKLDEPIRRQVLRMIEGLVSDGAK